MSCRNCPSEKSSEKPLCESNQDHEGFILQRPFQLVVKYLPEGSALLSSSCCWLPVCFFSTFTGCRMHMLILIARLSWIFFLRVQWPLLASRNCEMFFLRYLSWPLFGAFDAKDSVVECYGESQYVSDSWLGRKWIVWEWLRGRESTAAINGGGFRGLWLPMIVEWIINMAPISFQCCSGDEQYSVYQGYWIL